MDWDLHENRNNDILSISSTEHLCPLALSTCTIHVCLIKTFLPIFTIFIMYLSSCFFYSLLSMFGKEYYSKEITYLLIINNTKFLQARLFEYYTKRTAPINPSLFDFHSSHYHLCSVSAWIFKMSLTHRLEFIFIVTHASL